MSADGSKVVIGNGGFGSGHARVFVQPSTDEITEHPTPAPTPGPTTFSTNTPTITLAETSDWSIFSDGDVTEESLTSDIIQISLPFNTINRDYDAEVFTNDCLTPFHNSAFNVSTSDRISVEPDGFVQFNSTLTMNITSINGTVYWNKLTVGI
jgi:hypothetical protein